MTGGDARDELGGDGNGGDRLRQLVEPAVLVAALISTLTALLYYLGYTRALVVCNYFGVEVGLLGYSVPDFVLRASRVVFDPLPMIGMAVLAGLAGHLLLAWWLRRQSPQSRRYRAVVPVLAGVTLVLFAAALDGFDQLPAGPGKVSARGAAITLGLGAVLAEYSFGLAEFQRLHRWRQLRRNRRRRRPPPLLMPAPLARLRRGVLAGLLALAMFWLFVTEATRQGGQLALDIAGNVRGRPETIVYTKRPLQLPAEYGVSVSRLPGGEGDWRFRYTDLHILFHAGGRWFLLPASWRPDNDISVIILTDDPESLRIEVHR